MMPARYVRNVQTFSTGMDGVYAIKHARFPSSTRFVCSYADGNRFKDEIFEMARVAGQVENLKFWHFHHVVEGKHYADVDFRGHLQTYYEAVLPTVLLSAREHSALNGLLSSAEGSLMFRDQSLPRLKHDRARAVANIGRDNRTGLQQRIAGLRSMYGDVYADDAVLRKIAENVFDELMDALG
ncbi:MAG: hypothetical protein H7099_13180 [Gemmatimonadaceae bacterium]|nr:hypothetical protein [Gemmatimonadaceae bacterium]